MTSMIGECCVNAVIKENELDFVVVSGQFANEEITRMRVGVDETFFEDHRVEGI